MFFYCTQIGMLMSQNANESIDASRTEQRKRNVRTALILASIAVVFFIGFLAKYILLGR